MCSDIGDAPFNFSNTVELLSKRQFEIHTYLLFYFIYFRPTPTQTTEDNSGFFSNLNPFGKTTVVQPKTNQNENTPNEENPPTTPELKKLTKVSSMPIAGYTFFQKEREEKEFFPEIRYVGRENGNIYKTFADDIKERKFSNTVIPKVYEAFFGDNGQTIIMR